MKWIRLVLLLITTFCGGYLIGQGYRVGDSPEIACGILLGVSGVYWLSVVCDNWKRGRVV